MIKTLFTTLAVLSIGALTLQSCDKVKDKLASGHSGDISWDGDDLIINVPVTSDTALHYSTGTFEMDIDSFINANNTSGLNVNLSVIDTFKVTSCSLTILNPTTGDNFQDFELCGLYLNTNINTNTLAIGEIMNNPDSYSSFLNLPMDATVNYKDYLSDGKVYFNYLIGAQMRRPTTSVLQVKVHVTYDFHYIFQ